LPNSAAGGFPCRYPGRRRAGRAHPLAAHAEVHRHWRHHAPGPGQRAAARPFRTRAAAGSRTSVDELKTIVNRSARLLSVVEIEDGAAEEWPAVAARHRVSPTACCAASATMLQVRAEWPQHAAGGARLPSNLLRCAIASCLDEIDPEDHVDDSREVPLRSVGVAPNRPPRFPRRPTPSRIVYEPYLIQLRLRSTAPLAAARRNRARGSTISHVKRKLPHERPAGAVLSRRLLR